MLEIEFALRIHQLTKQYSESSLLKPFWEKVLTPKRKLVDVCIKEYIVDCDSWLPVRTHPVIGNYMNKKASASACYWIVLNDFKTDRRLAINRQKRNCNRYEVSFFLEQLSLKAILCYWQVEDCILNISIIIVCIKRAIKC